MRTLAAFGPLTEAEQRILDEIDTGEATTLGGLPDAGDETRRVRAAFLRMLILGRDPACAPHEKGVRVAGAWITETLDLEGCRVEWGVELTDCRFAEKPVLRATTLRSLRLDGSHMPGIASEGIQTLGGLFLRGAVVRGEANFIGAQIGRDFVCADARFFNRRGKALVADLLHAHDRIIMRAAEFYGEVRLVAAKAGGNITCIDASFDNPSGRALYADRIDVSGGVYFRGAIFRGAARLIGARVGGDLACERAVFDYRDGDALDVSGATIGGSFVLRKQTVVNGRLRLVDGEIGSIDDDPRCWPGLGDLDLNRCRYGAFTGSAPTDAASRLDWLARQCTAVRGNDFQPQPYVQLAKVLREMGHEADARRVLIEKERLQRAAEVPRERRAVSAGWDARRAMHHRAFDALRMLDSRRRGDVATMPEPTPRPPRVRDLLLRQVALSGRRVWDALLDSGIRHGYQPFRAVLWAIPFVIVGCFVYGWAYSHSAMKPGAALWARSPEWAACAGEPDRVACFLAQPGVAAHPRLQPIAYSIDVFLPVFDLDQQAHWRPASEAPGGGWVRAFLWLQITAGWALSLLAIAGFSGMVKKD